MSLAELLPEYVQATALLGAGLWAYWRFFRQRSNEPATDIDVHVNYVCTQGGFHIVEVTATLENKSLVRHSYDDFRMTLRYILEGDDIKDSDERHHYQLNMPHSIDDRIHKKQRTFANVGYINPRQRFQHRYETFVPAGATILWVHCKFAFTKEPSLSSRVKARLRGHAPSEGSSPQVSEETVFMDTQKLFALPAIASMASGGTGTPDPSPSNRATPDVLDVVGE